MTAQQWPPVDTARPTLSAELLHDLRTSINHIIGYSEMLAEQAEAEGPADFIPALQNIHIAGRQLLALLDNGGPSQQASVPSDTKPSTAAMPLTAQIGMMTEQLAPGVSQPLILVVDDNAMNRAVLSSLLQRQGYSVALAAHGGQALDMVRAQAFDLVLLDIMMPEIDGYTVLRQLKADEALRHIPVIMVSALDELDNVVRCIELGAEDYLPLPFNPTLLKARIGASIEKKRARDRDITERRQAELVSIRLGSVVEASDDAIISWTLAGVIMTWNKGAEKTYGYTAAEMVGQPITILLPPNCVDHEALLLNVVKRGEQINYMETVRVHKQGRLIDISLTASPIRDGSDAVIGVSAIARDITERKQAEEEHALLASIVASSYDAIVAKTLDGIILSWNQSAERLYGYAAADVIGHSFSILVPSDRAGEVQHMIDRVRRGEHIEDYETVRLRQDGTSVEVALTASPIIDTHGHVTGISTIAHDITERKQIDRMKSEFISTVSHELRTPLTSIRGALGLVTGGVTGPLSSQAKTMLDIADKNSERLVRLITDILDIEKMESGTLIFVGQVLELTPLVKQAIDANRGYADQFGVSYVLTHAEPGLQVNGNVDHLMQVLNNVLANAAKFSSANGTVEISVLRQGDTVRVAVTDQGMGISEEFRGRIFQKFAQADSSDSRQKGGTGLGLSIARAIVEKHGGQIDFTTEGSSGTTFYFDLPVWQEVAATS